MIRVVRNNLSLKLLAIALAIVGWTYFHFAANSFGAPEPEQLSIPITPVNLAVEYVARFTDREALVTVTPNEGQPPLKPDDIKAVLDLSNKGPGVYNVPIALVAPQIAVQSLSPASVTLTVERVEQRAFNVTIHFIGAPNGIVVGTTRIRPDLATVRASTSVLSTVAAMHADIALPSTAKGVDVMVRPIPVDASGAEVQGVAVSPNLVRVQMSLAASATK